MKFLFVGDSDELVQAMSIILKVRWRDLSLIHATEARQATELIHREQPDIVLLQIDAASPDDFDLIGEIRSFSDVPLIALSPSKDVMDKVRALEMGADDCIPPSSPMEYIAKVNAILRRCSPLGDKHTASFLCGKLTINYATHDVYVNGKPVELTPIEYKILYQLVRNEGSVVGHKNLLNSVWGPHYGAAPEFLKKYIHRLRSKIEEDPADPKIICTIRGVGYAFITASDSTE
ncbi:MAG: winged helix-turn-helix domain-containing protein [Dehalococcoidia bacterium]